VLKKFYDTNALIELQDTIFKENFVCSLKSIEELENIKTSANKDQNIKYKARQLVKLLDKNIDKYEVVITDNKIFDLLQDMELEYTPDNIILACAYQYNKHSPIEFITADVACKLMAIHRFGLKVGNINLKEKFEYKGFKEIMPSDNGMAYFYENKKENIYKLLINEYLVIKDNNNEIIDCYRWNGQEHKAVHNKPIEVFKEKIKPKDIYQKMVIDSILNNTITAISGKAGSGKTYLALMTAMYLIEKGNYNRLVVLHNPTPVRGSQQMGYYSGNALEKAMQSNIGHILITKFGDRYIVDEFIQQDKLKLVAMCDCRGMEVKDSEILYITESQNTTIDLLKLCLSRVSENAKVIIEGDHTQQVDNVLFEGNNNGMKRAIDVLKGTDIFGYVELQNIWRSKLANLVDMM